jgi:cellulose biosynthesis protein BcsQ
MAADTKLADEAVLRETNGSKISEELNKFIKKHNYDWVLIDMPPSNMILNEICFSYMADYIIVPFSSDMFSLDGYGVIAEAIKNARKINPKLCNLGVYLARYMSNCALDKYIKNELSERLLDKNLNKNDFIDIQIPLASDIREAVFYGRPISYYKEFSNSCKAYETLVYEMIKRIKSGR